MQVKLRPQQIVMMPHAQLLVDMSFAELYSLDQRLSAGRTHMSTATCMLTCRHWIRSPKPATGMVLRVKKERLSSGPRHPMPIGETEIPMQSTHTPAWVTTPPEGHVEFVLQQISPSPSERRFTQRAILFGRVEKVCDVVINHVSASRVHACVAFDNTGTLQLADLGSTHGMDIKQTCFIAL